jgi:hypothetical protein
MAHTWTILTCSLLALASTGCTKITNLTASRQIRNSSGLYPVEMAWASRQASVKTDTIQPYVQVGEATYPMRRTPMIANRWETLVPIPNTNTAIYYRFKVDYEFSAVPAPQKNSRLSPEYRLDIISPK